MKLRIKNDAYRNSSNPSSDIYKWLAYKAHNKHWLCRSVSNTNIYSYINLDDNIDEKSVTEFLLYWGA